MACQCNKREKDFSFSPSLFFLLSPFEITPLLLLTNYRRRKRVRRLAFRQLVVKRKQVDHHYHHHRGYYHSQFTRRKTKKQREERDNLLSDYIDRFLSYSLHSSMHRQQGNY